MCYGGGRGWRPSSGEWTWCHCWVPLQRTNLYFKCSFCFQGHQFHPATQENGNELCLELLTDVTLFSTLITQNLVFAIWGLCWYNFFWWVIPNMVNHWITCHGTKIMKADLDTPTALIWPFLFDAAVQLCVIIVEWLLLRELTTPDYLLNCWECCHFTRDWSDWLEN